MTPKRAPIIFALALLAALFAATARAETMQLDIYGPGQRQLNLVLLSPMPVSGAAPSPMAGPFEKYLSQDLDFLPFLRLVPISDIIGQAPATGVRRDQIDFKALGLSRVDLAISQGWATGDNGKPVVELRLFETFTGRLMVGKAYGDLDKTNLSTVADRFAGVVMDKLTGHSGFFNSQLAFVKKTGKAKEIYKSTPQGRDLVAVTSNKGVNLSPAWSWDAKEICFTILSPSGHRLGIWQGPGKKILEKRFAGNTVIGPAYTPAGEIALTLGLDGSPNIYLLNGEYEPVKPLAKSWSIDVSPSFTSDGKYMAFASGRLGNPNVFIMDLATSRAQRVSYEGGYNTSPSISSDGRFVVYSRQVSGHHRIFIHDMETGQDRQISFGPGDDEEPTLGPDGYFVAFSSNRSGKYRLYLTTRHGDEAKLIPTGEGQAQSPAWTH